MIWLCSSWANIEQIKFLSDKFIPLLHLPHLQHQRVPTMALSSLLAVQRITPNLARCYMLAYLGVRRYSCVSSFLRDRKWTPTLLRITTKPIDNGQCSFSALPLMMMCVLLLAWGIHWRPTRHLIRLYLLWHRLCVDMPSLWYVGFLGFWSRLIKIYLAWSAEASWTF